MTTEQVLKDQTVIVADGKVVAIGSATQTVIPDGAKIIDGKGCYLMPGLADMHVHIGTETSNDAAPGQMLLYLANGITTVLNAGDFFEPVPDWAKMVRNGQLDGPTIYCAEYARGSIDGNPKNAVVTSEHEARNYVKNAKLKGYNFIKVYNGTNGWFLMRLWMKPGSNQWR